MLRARGRVAWRRVATGDDGWRRVATGGDGAKDELSVTDFMRKYGMPERINEEVQGTCTISYGDIPGDITVRRVEERAPGGDPLR